LVDTVGTVDATDIVKAFLWLQQMDRMSLQHKTNSNITASIMSTVTRLWMKCFWGCKSTKKCVEKDRNKTVEWREKCIPCYRMFPLILC
jgi:hypothetical protein